MEKLYSIIIALIFNAVDLLTGFICALKKKDIKSSKLRDGIFKKFAFLICYFLAWVLDNYGVYIGFDISINILPILVAYVVTTELVSILENIGKINPDLLPEKLKNIFHIIDDK